MYYVIHMHGVTLCLCCLLSGVGVHMSSPFGSHTLEVVTIYYQS